MGANYAIIEFETGYWQLQRVKSCPRDFRNLSSLCPQSHSSLPEMRSLIRIEKLLDNSNRARLCKPCISKPSPSRLRASLDVFKRIIEVQFSRCLRAPAGISLVVEVAIATPMTIAELAAPQSLSHTSSPATSNYRTTDCSVA
jgi:hypothetical protein